MGGREVFKCEEQVISSRWEALIFAKMIVRFTKCVQRRPRKSFSFPAVFSKVVPLFLIFERMNFRKLRHIYDKGHQMEMSN